MSDKRKPEPSPAEAEAELAPPMAGDPWFDSFGAMLVLEDLPPDHTHKRPRARLTKLK